MGLYKLCKHRERTRDRCPHGWWGAFQHQGKLHRVSLSKWANQEIHTKAVAQTVFDRMKEAARAGRLSKRDDREPEGPLTFAQFAQLYADKHARAKNLALAKTIDYRLKPLIAFFGPRRLTDIKTADIEDFIAELRKPRRVNGQPGRTLRPASVNRSVELLRHMLNWAVDREYIDKTPFRRGSATLIRPLLEDNKRRRRLAEQEEQELLDAAPPILRALMITALDTGMRRGAMLALRFRDIDWKRRLIVPRGSTTKSGRTRLVPISTNRLLAVLQWLRLDAEGKHKPDDAPVFSNEVGEPVKSFRKAWVIAVLRAHGVKPKWRRKGRYRHLTQECLDALPAVNRHWHDLRHEYASRLVERGVPLAQVRDLLGHASISTTERYDNQTLEALQAATERLEDGKGFDATASSRGTKFQESFKIEPHADSQPVDESDANALKDLALRIGSGTGNRTPVPWLRTTYPGP